MANPLKNSLKNPLKKVYEEFWVPVFGRVLNLFIRFLEGEAPKRKPTYNLRTKDEKISE